SALKKDRSHCSISTAGTVAAATASPTVHVATRMVRQSPSRSRRSRTCAITPVSVGDRRYVALPRRRSSSMDSDRTAPVTVHYALVLQGCGSGQRRLRIAEDRVLVVGGELVQDDLGD